MTNTNDTDADDDIHTGLERDIRMVEQRIDSTKRQLKSELRQLRISPSEPLTDTNITPQKFMRQGDGYGYHRARKARSKLTNLQSLEHRLEELKQRHEEKKERLKESE